MKKKEKPRRLTLSRETIQVLNDPALLDRARGGFVETEGEGGTTLGRLCPYLIGVGG